MGIARSTAADSVSFSGGAYLLALVTEPAPRLISAVIECTVAHTSRPAQVPAPSHTLREPLLALTPALTRHFSCRVGASRGSQPPQTTPSAPVRRPGPRTSGGTAQRLVRRLSTLDGAPSRHHKLHRLSENAAAADLELTPTDLAEITAVADQIDHSRGDACPSNMCAWLSTTRVAQLECSKPGCCGARRSEPAIPINGRYASKVGP